MKKKSTIYCALAVLLALASCKSEADNYTTALYGDASISAFSLGTINRYVNNEKTTFEGSKYAMQINQVTRTIENVDSLPMGSDITRVVCYVSTRNNGMVGIKSLTDDTFTGYRSTDSIDFRTDRTFRVVASNGQGYSDYTVKVNVHEEEGDTIVWKKVASTLPPEPTMPAGIKELLGRSTYEEYALSTDGKLMHKVEGETEWTEDLISNHSDIGYLSADDVALVSYPLALADSMDYVLLVCRIGGALVTWNKIVDNTGKQPFGAWEYMDHAGVEAGLLPYRHDPSLIRYDGVVFAFGDSHDDIKEVYESRDNGLTWQESERITLPEKLNYDGTTAIQVTTDKDNYIWLYCHGSNEVWKGRMNKMAWEVKEN